MRYEKNNEGQKNEPTTKTDCAAFNNTRFCNYLGINGASFYSVFLETYLRIGDIGVIYE